MTQPTNDVPVWATEDQKTLYKLIFKMRAELDLMEAAVGGPPHDASGAVVKSINRGAIYGHMEVIRVHLESTVWY